jgi:hypothetical protein
MGGLTRRSVAGVIAVVAVLAGLVPPVAAASFAPFGKPSASGDLGEDIVFRQPVTVDEAIGRAELLITFADAIGPTVIEAVPPSGTGPVELRYTLGLADQGHILPNTPLRASWRISPTGDPAAAVTGPETTLVYADKRFDWRTRRGDIVRVHWYEGDDTFGDRALDIDERAVARAASELGVTETEPVDFFIYANQDEFYDALGPSTRENVGGQADAGIRTLFALIRPSEIDQPWVETVIPHELTHLVFDTAVSNAYHFPPRWLNEGLAVYESEGYPARDRRDVEAGAKDGTLIPLTGLTGQFPTTGERFSLAYSESVSAVDYLIRAHGKDALIGLIRSYADGRTDDEAFQAAVGQSMAEFSDAWLADYDATSPVKTGPQPPPAGPVPSSWSTDGGPLPAGSSDPGPNAPAPSDGPSATAAPDGNGSSSSGAPVIAIVFLIGAVVLVVAIVIARRRRDAAT